MIKIDLAMAKQHFTAMRQIIDCERLGTCSSCAVFARCKPCQIAQDNERYLDFSLLQNQEIDCDEMPF